VGHIFSGADSSFRFPSVPIVIYLVGLAAQLEQLRTGQFGYLQNVEASLAGNPSSVGYFVGLLADFAQFGLILAALDAFAGSRSFRSRVVLIVLLLAEVADGLYAGSKLAVIVSVGSVGVVAVFAHGRLSKRAIVVGAIVVLVVFPAVNAYRASIRNASAESASLDQAGRSLVGVMQTTFSGLTIHGLFVNTPAVIAGRLREIDNVAIIRQKSPSAIPYEAWTDLVVDPMIDWIPRVVWSSKPIISTGQQFSEQYYEIPSTVLTASAVTVPGDLILHGGVVPLAVGMLFLGVLMHTLDVTTDPGQDRHRLLLFIPLLTLMIQSENGTTELLVDLLGLVLAVALASWFAFAPRKS
jgi:hypothetical protein